MRSIIHQCLILALLLWQVPSIGQISTAVITCQDDRVCLGDSAEATLTMVGKGPWDVVIHNNQGEYRVLPDIKSPYTIWLKPVVDNSYTIVSVVDRNGDDGIVLGSGVSLEVHPVTPVEILLDQTAYRKTDPNVLLVSDPPGADFEGYGVLGSYFKPANATPFGSPHEITCTYTNAFECKSRDTVYIHVIHGEANVVLVSEEDTVNTLCDDNAGYEIRGSNLDTMAGLFTLRRVDTPGQLDGYIVDEDSSDNLAIFNPTGLSGTFELVYIYQFDVLTVEATRQINVNNLEGLYIEGFPDIICKADDPYLLSPGLIYEDPGATYTISGPGISGNQPDGFYFDPGDPDVPLGPVTIFMEYTSSNGCMVKVKTEITVNFSPGVSFTFSPACAPAEGGIVSFTNTTSGKYAVESWEWDFGDPESGTQNQSNEENPRHRYGEPGIWQVGLTAYTTYGCVSENVQEIVLADQPVADMTWFHDCYISGESISFLDQSQSNLSEINRLVWTFMIESGSTIGVLERESPQDTVRFPFPSQDTYRVKLEVWNQEGCSDQVTREITLAPTHTLTASGYWENFNKNNSDWKTGPGDAVSWVLDEPDFTGFSAVPGDRAWYTELPSGDTTYLERSWVESPCFDFSQTNRPTLQLDLMKSFRPGMDGAVIQYSEGTGGAWKTLGHVDEGINWYNVSDIENTPGGSDFGWGLDQFTPDTDWIEASHVIDMLSEKEHVKFRVAVATGGAAESGNQGFAFDNFKIAERTRVSVLEHFTNSSQEASKAADDVVDAFALGHRGTVIDLQYHRDYPGGADPMYDNNREPPDRRSFFYGVAFPPYSVLNGRSEPEFRFDFSGPAEVPDEEILLQASSEEPLFLMKLDVDWGGESMEITATTTCAAETFAGNVDLYVVIMEHMVTAYKGLNQDTVFRNVVLKMLPSPGGKLLGNNWQKGESVAMTYNWEYEEFVEDIQELAVVAFINDRDNFEIMQAVADYHTPPLGIIKPMPEIATLSVYPNPASRILWVNLGEQADEEGSLRIMDLSGRIMMEQEVKPGYAVHRLEVSTLPEGIYMICWIESGILKGRAKLVRAR